MLKEIAKFHQLDNDTPRDLGGSAMLEHIGQHLEADAAINGIVGLGEATIREARDSDAAGIIEVIRATYAEYPGCIFDLENELPELKKPASYFAADKGKLWIAEREGEVVGTFGFLPAEKAGGVELQKVCLRYDQRGSGLAARMFEIALAEAHGRGARFIELWTDTRFQSAHRFYEKLGFKRMPGERLVNDLSRSSEVQYLLKLA
ncbi:GNAT family N-acetyltransferase [Dongia soli]|uniref:GNAT family N-acetyltransferase n=1 Tax=Dongia soli TaxID=600628 RepID=A0ABU5EAN5_9PROT|nr:GNAT family N-acetyltransferase [Dongia soli]MDY0883420.1 GNAT family N-acetyltransferase [Dongia soli]